VEHKSSQFGFKTSYTTHLFFELSCVSW